ncbi:MAG: sigma-70 family RNA polymerase sigma factor [Clostridia bacterium]|nr:sigma-70 family RNA polymerase sigma factor [Clostridia bacterium]
MTEKEIVNMIYIRREAGMEELVRHYSPLVRYIIKPILENEHDREECLSDVMMSAWNNISQYNENRGSLSAWLTAIARNTALNRARNNKKHAENDELDEKLPSANPTPEQAVLENERKLALKRALDKLEKTERLLFYRKYYYMQPTAQIAREMGMTERAVEGRLYRIKQKLRKLMGGDERD